MTDPSPNAGNATGEDDKASLPVWQESLLLLAIADDALGLMLLAVFYPSGPLSFVSFVGFMIPAVAVCIWLKRRPTMSFWPYVVLGGGLSWCALYFGGVHPSLALVPILPFMPHEKRDLGLFDEAEARLPYTMNRFEHAFHVPVQVVLFFFGLANGGVPFGSVGTGTWIVFVALLAGTTNRAAATEFATAAFDPGPVLDEAKMGALFSFAAAPAAILLGRAFGLRPGRQPDASRVA